MWPIGRRVRGVAIGRRLRGVANRKEGEGCDQGEGG